MAAVKVLGTCGGANTVAAAGNYAAGDVISNDADNGEGAAWVFSGCARIPAGGGFISGAYVQFSAQSMVARCRLWLFNELPTASELDDNAAFSLDADDQDKQATPYPLEFTALVDHGEVVCGYCFDKVPFQCAGSSVSLWGILQFIDAETNEAAAMVCKVALFIDPQS